MGDGSMGDERRPVMPRPAASVVLTIRSDFFDPLMHSAFAPLLKDTLVQLGRIHVAHPHFGIELPS